MPDTGLTTDAAAMIRGVAEGEAGALRRLYDAQAPRLFGVAMAILRDRDAAALSDLTAAYLGHLGSSGVLTSPKTLSAYRLGVRQYVDYTGTHAVGILRPGRHDAQDYVAAMLAAGRAPEGVQLKVAAARCLRAMPAHRSSPGPA